MVLHSPVGKGEFFLTRRSATQNGVHGIWIWPLARIRFWRAGRFRLRCHAGPDRLFFQMEVEFWDSSTAFRRLVSAAFGDIAKGPDSSEIPSIFAFTAKNNIQKSSIRHSPSRLVSSGANTDILFYYEIEPALLPGWSCRSRVHHQYWDRPYLGEPS